MAENLILLLPSQVPQKCSTLQHPYPLVLMREPDTTYLNQLQLLLDNEKHYPLQMTNIATLIHVYDNRELKSHTPSGPCLAL